MGCVSVNRRFYFCQRKFTKTLQLLNNSIEYDANKILIFTHSLINMGSTHSSTLIYIHEHKVRARQLDSVGQSAAPESQLLFLPEDDSFFAAVPGQV